MHGVTNNPPRRRANPKAPNSVVSATIVVAVTKTVSRKIGVVVNLRRKAVTVAKAAISSKSLVKAHKKTAMQTTHNKAKVAAVARTVTVAEVVVVAVEVIAAAIKKLKPMATQRLRATTLTAIAPSHKQPRY